MFAPIAWVGSNLPVERHLTREREADPSNGYRYYSEDQIAAQMFVPVRHVTASQTGALDVELADVA
jgi:hypothetical protein